MVEKLGEAALKSGETLEIGVAVAPEEALAEGVERLLGHKGVEWRAHIHAALTGETDSLETRFYLGLLDGAPVANIMTVERHGVGILGHVFTQPEHRRKGICQAVMERQMAHFRQRGGHVLTLGTGFESPPYWIYHSFGFHSLQGGIMRYAVELDNAFDARWFAPGPAQVVSAEWRHWPLVALLASVPGSEFLRSVGWRVFGIGNLEGPYVAYMHRRQNQEPVGAVMLETAQGAVVGCANFHPTAWPHVSMVDVFTHPNFTDRIADLVRGLALPPGKLIAWVDTEGTEKAAGLEAAGFAREGTLRGFLRMEETPRDAWLYGREA